LAGACQEPRFQALAASLASGRIGPPKSPVLRFPDCAQPPVQRNLPHPDHTGSVLEKEPNFLQSAATSTQAHPTQSMGHPQAILPWPRSNPLGKAYQQRQATSSLSANERSAAVGTSYTPLPPRKWTFSSLRQAWPRFSERNVPPSPEQRPWGQPTKRECRAGAGRPIVLGVLKGPERPVPRVVYCPRAGKKRRLAELRGPTAG